MFRTGVFSGVGSLAPIVLVGLALAPGCSPTPASTPAQQTSANRVVYEGLPHSNGEPKGYETEKLSGKPLIERAGYDFYADPITLKPDDLKTLIQVLNDPTTLQAWVGEKKCGGFHPDYAAEWQDDADKRTILLCFTCGEAKVIRAENVQRYDLNQQADKSIDGLMKSYRKNRPRPRAGEGAG